MTPKTDGSARTHWQFPAIVIGLLLFSVGSQVYLVASSQSDGGAQVEKNYYSRALGWDETQQREAVSDALGWHMAIRATVGGDVVITVTDSRGEPVNGLSGAVELRRPSVAAGAGAAPLVSTGPGTYSAALPVKNAGLWDFTVTATGEDAAQFQSTVRLDIGG